MIRDLIIKHAETMSAVEQYKYGCTFFQKGDLKTALTIFLMAEKKGSLDAKYSIASIYYMGQGVTQDVVYAIKVFKELAQKKHSFANYMMGEIYREGKYVEQDYVKASKFYQSAVKAGNPYAMHHLALMYEKGMGVEQDFDKAIALYKSATKLKHLDSMYNLAVKYIQEKNRVQEGIDILEEAFSLGDVEAKCYLAQIYHDGEFVEKDNEKAMRFYQQAAQKGDGKAYFNIAMFYLTGEAGEVNQEKAIENMMKAVNLGVPEAYYSMGQIYFVGDGVDVDVEKALSYYKRAAKAGHVDANYNLAVVYHKGINVEVDNYRAIKYYRKAVELGSVDAMNNLGTMYAMGVGVEQDAEMAHKYYEMAAEKGNVGAMFNLGENLFEDGFEREEQVLKAISYYETFVENNSGLDDVYLYYAYIRLVQSCFDLHCFQECNTKNRDIYYYKRTKELKDKAKKYCKMASEYKNNNSSLNVNHEFQLVLDVYQQIINDDDLDLSSLEYSDFKTRFFNKYDNLFLLTKNKETSLYDDGIKTYFDKRNRERVSVDEEVAEYRKRFEKRKPQIIQQLKNLNIANVEDCLVAIENEEVDRLKEEHIEDYSVCVINIDKYLEEILHYIFVSSLHEYNENHLKTYINTAVGEFLSKYKDLNTEFLGKIKEVVVGKKLPEKAKNLREKNLQTISKFIARFNAQNNLDESTLEVVSKLEEFASNNALTEEEQNLISTILDLKQKRIELENLNCSQKFELGSLFYISFIDVESSDGVTGVTQKVMNKNVIDFVQSINPEKAEFDVKIKLRELLLKIEMFRVTARNVASHKSIFNKTMAEKGINLCIAQNNSIFDLLEELFGDYINQKYLDKLIQRAIAKQKNEESPVLIEGAEITI